MSDRNNVTGIGNKFEIQNWYVCITHACEIHNMISYYKKHTGIKYILILFNSATGISNIFSTYLLC